MKNKELQIAQDNVSALMEGKFSFRPENILNKTILFDASRVHEETIINKIIENLPLLMTSSTLSMNREQTHFL